MPPLGTEVRLWRSCADGDFLATGTLFGATSPLGTHPARRHHGPDGWPTFINLRPAVTRIKASLDVGAGGNRTAFAMVPSRAGWLVLTSYCAVRLLSVLRIHPVSEFLIAGDRTEGAYAASRQT